MKKRFLENAPLFGVLSDDERQTLADRFTLRSLADSETLFGQGVQAEAMYLVKSGVVRLYEGRSADGEGRMLATFGPSSVLGEIDLLLNRTHETTAIAHGPVDLWELTRDALRAAMGERPAMSIKLSGFLGERVAEVDGYLVERLGKVPLLAELPQPALESLAGALRLQDVRRGSLIFQSGAPSDQLFIVESGTVTIVSTAPDDPAPFRQLGSGELFGHEALLRNRQYGAVARAATDVQLWALARGDFERVTSAHPGVRLALAEHANVQGLAPADRAAARDTLRRVPLFAELGDELLDAVASRLTLRHLGTNETVFTAGDPGDTLFLVDHGTVKLLDEGTLVERREEGEFFGELALLTGRPRELTARAARPTNLWQLAKRDFDALSVRYPPLTSAVGRLLSQVLARDADSEQAAGESLAAFPLFTGLTPREQADVARRLHAMSVRANDVIYRRGAPPDAFYLVRRGQVKLVSDQGVFALVRAGGFFGEMALLTGNNHTVSAQAVEESELLVLDRLQFEGVMNRYPKVALVLSRALSARLEEANTRGQLSAAESAAPAPLGRGQGEALATGRIAPAAPPRARDGSALAKFMLVMIPLFWLMGISLPTMVLTDASRDAQSPLHNLAILGASPTPSPTGTAAPTAPASATAPPSPTPSATPEPTPTPTRTPRPMPSPTPPPNR